MPGVKTPAGGADRPLGRSPKSVNTRAAKESKEKAVRRIASILGKGSLGLAMARKLVKRGVRTRAAMRKPEVMRGLPKEFQMNIMYPSPANRVGLAEADALADELTRRVIFCPVEAKPNECFRFPLYIVGSIRRRAPRVKDVDLLVHLPARLASSAGRILDSVRLSDSKPSDRAIIMDTYIGGDRHKAIIVRWAPVDDGYGARRPSPKFFHADLFLVVGGELPFALYHYTGPTAYNLRTRALAKKKGWLLNQYGIWVRSTGKPAPGSEKIKTEQDVQDFLGVSHRDPTQR
jgi:DNA polymerase (family 10)